MDAYIAAAVIEHFLKAEVFEGEDLTISIFILTDDRGGSGQGKNSHGLPETRTSGTIPVA